MCGSECEDKGYHPLECEAYVASGYKPKLEDFTECNPMYESVLPLRCLLLEKKYPKKWETLIAMESHDELRKDTELWETEQKNVVEFLQEKVKIKHSSELIHRVTGILDVNCHEVRSNIPDTKNEFRARGIYPLCAMMSHDCSSNTHHTVMDEMVMLVLASRNIYKGTQITGTVRCGIVNRLTNMIYTELQQANENDPLELEVIFKKYQCILHPNHYHLIGLKHSLGQIKS
ncbi:Protein msta, isoform A [Armadillidium vulgare]|nr:Protein msta, isoform A [Armadillidium vulgare]